MVGVTFQSDQSVFNMAQAYLMRIDRLLYITAECQSKRELRKWFNVFRSVYALVKIKFKPEEIEKLNTKDKEIDEFFKTHPFIDLGEQRTFNFNGNIISKPNQPAEREELYLMIERWQEQILRLADKYGLLLPNRADPRFAVPER